MEKRIFYSQNKEDDVGSRQGRPKQEKWEVPADSGFIDLEKHLAQLD